MKLIVFGASGGVGKEVVRQALDAGHQVTAYVRDSNKLPIQHTSLTIIQGDGLDENAVQEAIKGHEAVISCIGSRGTGATTLMSDVTRHVIAGMQEHGVARISYVASAGIHSELKGVMGFLLSRILKNVLDDHRRAYELLAGSKLHWTVARPLQLTDGPWTGQYRQADAAIPKGGQKISRADTAHFLLTAVTESGYDGKSVALAY